LRRSWVSEPADVVLLREVAALVAAHVSLVFRLWLGQQHVQHADEQGEIRSIGSEDVDQFPFAHGENSSEGSNQIL
jgi:hypothetical protein